MQHASQSRASRGFNLLARLHVERRALPLSSRGRAAAGAGDLDLLALRRHRRLADVHRRAVGRGGEHRGAQPATSVTAIIRPPSGPSRIGWRSRREPGPHFGRRRRCGRCFPGPSGNRSPWRNTLADVLLASLDPAVVAHTDIPDAVRIDGVVLSRSDLVGAATSVAERVAGAHRVAVLATPTASTVLAITGCLIAGVPVVPVPADVGVAERRHMLTDSGAQAWLGPVPDEPEGLPHIPVRLHARSWHRYPEPSPEATAMVIYTSGTTGLPKGVQLSRRAIAADLDALAEAWQWTPDDVLVHGLPLFHVHGLVLGLLGSLRVGNRFVHTGKPTPGRLCRPPRRHPVLRRADGVVAGGGRPARPPKRCEPARLLVSGSAAAAGAGVRPAGRAHRASADRTVWRLGVADHPVHPRRRRTARRAGWGCRWPACRPGWSTTTAGRCRTTGKPLASFRFGARRCSTAT